MMQVFTFARVKWWNIMQVGMLHRINLICMTAQFRSQTESLIIFMMTCEYMHTRVHKVSSDLQRTKSTFSINHT